jgi:hypothetical protein
MIYRLFADITLILHFCFVTFVIFGGLLVLRRRFVLWLHLPALIWGVLIEFFGIICPLTTLENYFRGLGGEAGYEGGFIEHYVSALVYWQLTAETQILLGLALIALNLLIYFFVFRQTQTRFINS